MTESARLKIVLLLTAVVTLAADVVRLASELTPTQVRRNPIEQAGPEVRGPYEMRPAPPSSRRRPALVIDGPLWRPSRGPPMRWPERRRYREWYYDYGYWYDD
jgi:hypothetical protein